MQHKLIQAGYPLRKHGADGELGPETMAALNQFAQARKLAWSYPEVSREILAALDAVGMTAPVRVIDGIQVYDLRACQADPPRKENGKLNVHVDRGKATLRDPGQVTGIVIHQTAAKFGVAEYQVAQAGGDRRLALARRSLGVRCHVMALHEGFVAWPNDLRWYVYHGNDFNSFTLGIEIDGNYPGLRGRRTWNDEPATQVTEQVVAAARAGIHLLVEEGTKLGMKIQDIFAHRQSTYKRDDPGEELWRRVVLDYAVPTLGLQTHPGETWGKGSPLPIEWDPNGIDHY